MFRINNIIREINRGPRANRRVRPQTLKRFSKQKSKAITISDLQHEISNIKKDIVDLKNDMHHIKSDNQDLKSQLIRTNLYKKF
jgi:predicted  nucleic acid-binding Zn-ribbon protein